MQMYPAASLREALETADRLLGYEGQIIVIPQGVSTIAACEQD